jgi:hypothetical protein
MDPLGQTYTLQSNASRDLYPDNNASRFTVHIPKQLQFDERWAVGLCEIHFPLSFVGSSTQKNDKSSKQTPMSSTEYVIITEDGDRYSGSVERNKRSAAEMVSGDDTVKKTSVKKQKRDARDNSSIEEEAEDERERQSINNLDYILNSPVDFRALSSGDTAVIQPECRLTAEAYEKTIDQLEREWDKVVVQKKSKLDLCKAEKEAEIEQYETRLQELLAKHESALTQLNKELDQEKSMVHYWKDNFVSLAHLAYRDANQMNNVNIPKYLYVYCNVVKMSMVGNTYANYLHIARVPPIRINGDTAVERFNVPRYNRLSKQSFDAIEVMIRDEKGRLVQFEKSGVVIIILHFKPIH